MTFISLTDCCRHLAIDPKTFHRWLAHAQLSLQPHPTDGRLKGLSREHLLLLARLHHRAVGTPSQEEPATPALADVPPLPKEMLALPAMLTALQAHILTLQQQLSTLTHLLHQHTQPLTVSVSAPAHAPAVPLTQSASRSPRTTAVLSKPSRPPAHVLPLVEVGRNGHVVLISPTHGLLSLEPDTPQWFAWLATLSSFRFVGTQGPLTVHREINRLPRAPWRAHRQIRNHTYNLHLGHTEDLTIAVLEQAAAALHAHLK